jgi:hypothetical protein
MSSSNIDDKEETVPSVLSSHPPPPPAKFSSIFLLWLLGMSMISPSVASPPSTPFPSPMSDSRSLPGLPSPSDVKSTTFLSFYMGDLAGIADCCNWSEQESVLVNSFAFSTLASAIWNLWKEFTEDSPEIRVVDGPHNFWVSPGQTLETFQLTEHAGMDGGMWTFSGFDPQELVEFMCGVDTGDEGAGDGSGAGTPAPVSPSTSSPSPAPSLPPSRPNSTAPNPHPTPKPNIDLEEGAQDNGGDEDSFDGSQGAGSALASTSNCSFSSYASHQSPCTAAGVRTITFDFLPGYKHCDASFLPAKIEDHHCDFLAPLSLLGVFVFLHSALAIFTVGRLAFQLCHHEKKNALAIRMSQPLLTKIFLSGCASACVCNVFYLGPNTDVTCNLRTWSFNIFFTLSYAALNLKLYRVYVVFKRGAVDGTAGKKVGNRYLLTVLAKILCFEISLLAGFLLVDPEHSAPVTTHFSNVYSIEDTDCVQGTVAQGVTIFVWKAFMTCVGIYLAQETRGLPSPNLCESTDIQDCTIEAAMGYGFYLVMSSAVDSNGAKMALKTVCISMIAVNGATKIFRPKVSLARVEKSIGDEASNHEAIVGMGRPISQRTSAMITTGKRHFEKGPGGTFGAAVGSTKKMRLSVGANSPIVPDDDEGGGNAGLSGHLTPTGEDLELGSGFNGVFDDAMNASCSH